MEEDFSADDRRALQSPNRITAMVACKQLHAFAPFGSAVDVYEAFARALERPEPAIRGEAGAQLEALGTARARELLG